MKNWIGLGLLSCCFFNMAFLEAAAGQSQLFTKERRQAPVMRILIGHKLPNAQLEVKGNYNLIDPYQGVILGNRLYGKSRLIEPLATGLKWGEEFPGLYQLKVLPSGPQSLVIVNGVPYQGNVTFYDVGGAISIVNELSVEEYLTTQLANQTNSKLPDEALAAIAIAARSQAYYQMSHPKSAHWDVDAQNVGYKGARQTSRTLDVEAAVNATRFMVLTQPQRSGEIEIFPALWAVGEDSPPNSATLVATQAILKAQSGAHAAQILEQTFPGTFLQRIYSR